jgi:hypothetical protein
MDPTNAAVQAFQTKNWPEFVKGLRAFRSIQTELELVAPTTLKLLEKIDGVSGIEVAKGSGSLGADTVVVFYPMEQKTRILAAVPLELLATEAQCAEGLHVKFSPAVEMTV